LVIAQQGLAVEFLGGQADGSRKGCSMRGLLGAGLLDVPASRRPQTSAVPIRSLRVGALDLHFKPRIRPNGHRSWVTKLKQVLAHTHGAHRFDPHAASEIQAPREMQWLTTGQHLAHLVNHSWQNPRNFETTPAVGHTAKIC